MRTFGYSLALASTLAGLGVGTAQAQVGYPAAELHGGGAASVAVTVAIELNAFGGTDNPLGNASDGSTSALNTIVSNGFNSATSAVQSTITGKYVSANSSAGRTDWKNFNTAFFTGTSTGTYFPSVWRPIWADTHFSMTETAISVAELGTYNTNALAAKGGAAIQFPLYVVPLALAFNPIYGHQVAEHRDLAFNIGQTVAVNGVTLPALRLTKKVYCSILNGYITNWNDSRIQALNSTGSGKTLKTNVSLKDPADSPMRWSSDGVPIRLVGRLDSAGATDVLTHHLSQVCGGGIMGQGNANLYLQDAAYLPFNPTSGIDLTTERADTAFNPSATASSFAGTANLLSGMIYDGTARVVRSARVKSGGALVAGTYVELPGKFIVADGNINVANAINLAPDKPSASNSNVLLNGKFGYVSGDQVRPANGLVAGTAAVGAMLEVGQTASTTKTVWAYPDSANAIAAFGVSILPPESDKNGKYVAGGSLLRANPRDWYQALYAGTTTLANPPAGYPITGTVQFLTATCFADPAVRNALVAFLQTVNGFVSKGVNNGAVITFKPAVFTGLASGSLGIAAQLNLAPLPAPWRQAILDTYLRDTTRLYPGLAQETNTLAVKAPLYIQTGLPVGKIPAHIDPATGKTVKAVTLKAGQTETAAQVNLETPGNPTCTEGAGVK